MATFGNMLLLVISCLVWSMGYCRHLHVSVGPLVFNTVDGTLGPSGSYLRQWTSRLSSIGSGNALSPTRQAISWGNTNWQRNEASEIWNKMRIISFKKINLKLLSINVVYLVQVSAQQYALIVCRIYSPNLHIVIVTSRERHLVSNLDLFRRSVFRITISKHQTP